VVAAALEMPLQASKRGVQVVLVAVAVTERQAVQELLGKAVRVALVIITVLALAAVAVVVKMLLAQMLAYQWVVMAAQAWRG
jgi:hypothetical protein